MYLGPSDNALRKSLFATVRPMQIQAEAQVAFPGAVMHAQHPQQLQSISQPEQFSTYLWYSLTHSLTHPSWWKTVPFDDYNPESRVGQGFHVRPTGGSSGFYTGELRRNLYSERRYSLVEATSAHARMWIEVQTTTVESETRIVSFCMDAMPQKLRHATLVEALWRLFMVGIWHLSLGIYFRSASTARTATSDLASSLLA